MTEQELETLLARPNNAIVGVNRADGAPHLTPVWFAWDGEAFTFSTTKDRAKYANIKRDANISLVVDDLELHQYVAAYGQAELIEQNTGERARPIIQKYVPADQVEQWVQNINNDPKRVLVVLHPDKLITR